MKCHQVSQIMAMPYFFKRLGFTVPLMLLISFLAFELMHVAPGGPFDKERAPASPEIKRALEAKFHLNEPVGKQYLRYLGVLWEKTSDGKWRRVDGGLIAGDFGPSMKYRNHTVNDIITKASRLRWPLERWRFVSRRASAFHWDSLPPFRRGN